VNLLRKASFVVAAGLALSWVASLPAEAGGLKPGHYAYSLLQYGSAWERYDAGCLTWNYRNQAWYSHCILPQNAVLYPHHPHRISVRD
jgi:hypothetical protein